MPLPEIEPIRRRGYRRNEIPAVTGISQKQVDRAIANGELRATRLSHRIVTVHVDDLDAWLRGETKAEAGK